VKLTGICVVLSLFILADGQSEPDFRNVNWGMSKDQVLAAEESKLTINDGDTIFYTTEVAGLKSDLVYSFLDGELVRAAYMVDEKYSNSARHYDNYLKVKELLSGKYGTAVTTQDCKWGSSYFQENPNTWGLALEAGQMSCFSKWTLPNTEIALGLRGDQGKVGMYIGYLSLKHKPATKASETKNLSKGL